MFASGPNRAYATLLTRPSYLPGVLILAHTLQKHDSKYPLIVLVTPSLPPSSLRVLEIAAFPKLIIRECKPLVPAAHQLPADLIAARFEDTWTKLRVFELTSYDAVCFLDADIAIFGDIDLVFSIADDVLPGKDWLAATHACVCNLDRDSWADADWVAENCAYTPQRHPDALAHGPRVPNSADKDPKESTQTLLNGGVFVFYPSDSLWSDMLSFFKASDKLVDMKFPDQDFLALYYRDRWATLPWRFNALKTMRYWHEKMWGRDEDVVALHYIVDKPWSRRIASDGIAGHLGRDGATHAWWWELWEEWIERVKEKEGFEEMMETLDGLVAQPLNEQSDRRQVEENMEKGLPVPVPSH